MGSLAPPQETQAELDAHIADDAVHSSGRELGYAEITSDFAQTASGGGTSDDVTGLTVTVTVGARPVVVHAWCQQLRSATAASTPQLRLFEGSTMLAIAAVFNDDANQGNSMWVRRRLAPTEGSHTYKLALWGPAGQALTLAASSSSPAHIQVIEV